MNHLLSRTLIDLHGATRVEEGFQWTRLNYVEHADWREVLTYGDSQIIRVKLDTGWVWFLLYAYAGRIFVFIPGLEDTPGVVERLKDGVAWHGHAFGMVV